jgi:hypothetical protein
MTCLDMKDMSLSKKLSAPVIQTSSRPPPGKNLPRQDGWASGRVGADSSFRGDRGSPVWVRGHCAQGVVNGNQLRSGHFMYRHAQGVRDPPSKAAWRAGQVCTGKGVMTRNELRIYIDVFRNVSASSILWATQTKV